MFALKWLLMAAGVAMFGTAAGVVGYDVYLAMQFEKLMGSGELGAAGEMGARRPIFGRVPNGARSPRWSLGMKLFAWGWVPLLLALSMVVVPEGSGGIRVSQISGVQQGTLYPGIHLIVPLVQRVAVYDLRDHLYTTVAAADAPTKNETLTVQSREGLTIGLAVSVRYRLDPQRLSDIHANFAQPVDPEIVVPLVFNAFCDLAPKYVLTED